MPKIDGRVASDHKHIRSLTPQWTILPIPSISAAGVNGDIKSLTTLLNCSSRACILVFLPILHTWRTSKGLAEDDANYKSCFSFVLYWEMRNVMLLEESLIDGGNDCTCLSFLRICFYRLLLCWAGGKMSHWSGECVQVSVERSPRGIITVGCLKGYRHHAPSNINNTRLPSKTPCR